LQSGHKYDYYRHMISLRITHLLGAVIALLVATQPVIASGGISLTSIGTLNTAGAQYPEWWYSGENPVLTGTAPAGAQVDIAINSISSSVTADASGNWTTATTMATGDHTVSLSTSGSNYTFTLHAGQTAPEGMSGAGSDLPVAGSFLPTLGLLGVGFALVLFGTKLAKAT
jgi:hypothetical protein